MVHLDRLAQAFSPQDDVLAPYRTRMAWPLTMVCAALLTPFLWLHLRDGAWVLAAATVVGQGVALACGLAIRRGAIPTWLLAIATAGVIGAIAVSMAHQGINAVFWAYPTLFITYFILPKPVARVCAALLLGSLALIGLRGLGPSVTLRVIATLGLNLALIEVVLRVVRDLQQALAREASTDALTGAWNRRELGRLLAESRPAGPDPARGLVLMAMDIDHFKRINDRHGHATGDRVLVETVQLIHGRIRRGDRLFRTGGEEFLLALPDTTLDVGQALAEALRARIADAHLLPDGEAMTLSIGVARLHAGRVGAQALHDVDRALYGAKAAGRNRVVLAEPSDPAPDRGPDGAAAPA